MSSALRSPRVIAAGVAQVPVHPPGFRPALGIGAIIVLAVVLGVVALVAEQPGFRILMMGGAVWAAVSAVAAVPWASALPEGRVRVDDGSAALRFVPASGVPAGLLAVAIVGVLLGGVLILLERLAVPGAENIGIGRLGPYAITIFSIAWLGQQLWAWRSPRGLTLDAAGVRGVRGARPVALAWDELASATVVFARGAKLVLTTTGGVVHVVEPRWIGSDPNLVAPIVEHFLRNPADRVHLSDPRAALAVVEAAVSPPA